MSDVGLGMCFFWRSREVKNMRRRILVGLGVMLLASVTSLQHVARAIPAVQNRQRTITVKDDRRSPLKIRTIQTKGKQVEPDKEIFDSDDWLKQLTVEMRNESSKTVTFVQVELFFPRLDPDVKQPGSSFSLDYGDNPFAFDNAAAMPAVRVKPVSPGAHLEITLTDAEFTRLNAFLIDTGFFVTSKVDIRVNLIGFSDGTAWSGQMVQRRPTGGWMPLSGSPSP
jgi:hypothetical protein